MRATASGRLTRRTRWVAALCFVAVLAAGCSAPEQQAPPLVPSAGPEAADAGGACHLLDFAVLEQRLGLAFEVAAAAKKDKTRTCVVRPVEATLPELSLSVTPTKADVAVFKDVVRPDGAKSVSGLGRGAFQVVLPKKKGRGPSVEVGWLAGNARLLLLKVTLSEDSDDSTVDEMTAKLIDVAKDIDKFSI